MHTLKGKINNFTVNRDYTLYVVIKIKETSVIICTCNYSTPAYAETYLLGFPGSENPKNFGLQ